MDKNEIAKWLVAAGKNGKITRCKLKCEIYSSVVVRENKTVSLSDIDITFSSVEHPEKQPKKNGMFLGLHCEAVVNTDDIDTAISILNHCLLSFFVLAKAEYLVKEPIHKIVECDGEWIGTPGIHAEGIAYHYLDDDFIEKYQLKLDILSHAKNRSNDVYRKLVKALHLIKNAIELESLWPAESFLNFYKIIEITADEIKKLEYRDFIEQSPLVEDLIDLIADNTQRLKVYFLYEVFKLSEFDKKQTINLGNIRNKIAHSSYQPSHEEICLCKNFSFIVFSKFIELVGLRAT